MGICLVVILCAYVLAFFPMVTIVSIHAYTIVRSMGVMKRAKLLDVELLGLMGVGVGMHYSYCFFNGMVYMKLLFSFLFLACVVVNILVCIMDLFYH